ncbi:MAG: Holliday junction resolvase RuvX [Nitrospiraceae bacterium]|nr:Holliday junction resolvase RuvX [Nitrospiraceae bacterium]
MLKGQRILAIDYGTKRVGFALSDELGWTAQPLETFQRRSPEADLRHIQDLVREHEVGRVLIGMPFRLDGELGPAARAVAQFVRQVEAALSVPVVTWDERMTTRSAEDLLIAADVSRRKRKGIVDRIAAAILLQSYLRSLDETTGISQDFDGEAPLDGSASSSEEHTHDANESDHRAVRGGVAPDGDCGLPDAAVGTEPRR